MKTNLMMDFTVNRETHTVNVKREFAAKLPLVWAAWTEPEILDQWWAPRPYKTVTKSMDFREGGYWLYAMISPENETHWCRGDYLKISQLKGFEAIDAFCNEEGEVNTDFPRSTWETDFTENGSSTTVDIQIKYNSLADLETVVEMGFKEGFTAALKNLDDLLADDLKEMITVEVVVEAPAAKAWEYWTSPEHITQWNHANDEWHCPYAENDLQMGGRFKSVMASKDGKMSFDFSGTYNFVIPHQKIAYTLDDERKVFISFDESNGSTKIMTVFEAEGTNSVEMQQAGWQAIADSFKRHVEAN